ncbi:enhancer of mRNA-decapping protein 3 [[Candida] anglica]|uniref:Enhancer of mRNA-decapping protein 3 n=1 Tax=[Candida] anglica TaxID=148631 RepID=A0ABP0EJB1_9ASCO
MSEFINYKVNIFLRDGTQSTGTITHVDSQKIVLGSESSNGPIHIDSHQIADLKVVQLPQDFLKKLKNNKKGKKEQQQQRGGGTPVPGLLDDAIVFAKPSSNQVQKVQDSNSRSNTPKLKSQKSHQFPTPSTGTSDPVDWNNDSDVQQIKSSNEFDFAANLAMFDKKSVFADFQRNDNVSPSERLVGHNKLENVEKEKYKNDEMVLDNTKSDNWHLIGAKTTQTNKKSGMTSGGRGTPVDESFLAPVKRTFKLINSESGEVVPLCSPVQSLEIERLASESYGITSDIMSENGAVNLSQLILQSILGGHNRLSNKKNHNLPPLVLLLIGSGKCGARAFATGRHLTNHGVRVLAFVASGEESEEILSHQREIFEMAGGKVISSDFQQLLNILYNELDTPVELIIDALQGYDDHLEDIFFQEEDVKVLQNIIEWCNEPLQQTKVMSLDIPSGIDGGSGTVSDFGLKLNCKWCVSMGLPSTGLLHAYKNGLLPTGVEGEVLHYVVDVGIPNKLFSSKGNLRKFDKFWFSAGAGIKLEVNVE